jgi:cation transport ATPase
MAIRLGTLHRRLLYAITIFLTATGVLWLVPHYLLAGRGGFGAPRSPLEPWALRLHGAAAMGFLVGFGSMLPFHIRQAWQLRRNVRTGLAMLFFVGLLIVTAYALYYASSEDMRPWISFAHWTFGLVLLPWLVLHERIGRSTARTKVDLPATRRHTGPAAANSHSKTA